MTSQPPRDAIIKSYDVERILLSGIRYHTYDEYHRSVYNLSRISCYPKLTFDDTRGQVICGGPYHTEDESAHLDYSELSWNSLKKTINIIVPGWNWPHYTRYE